MEVRVNDFIPDLSNINIIIFTPWLTDLDELTGMKQTDFQWKFSGIILLRWNRLESYYISVACVELYR